MIVHEKTRVNFPSLLDTRVAPHNVMFPSGMFLMSITQHGRKPTCLLSRCSPLQRKEKHAQELDTGEPLSALETMHETMLAHRRRPFGLYPLSHSKSVANTFHHGALTRTPKIMERKSAQERGFPFSYSTPIWLSRAQPLEEITRTYGLQLLPLPLTMFPKNKRQQSIHCCAV